MNKPTAGLLDHLQQKIGCMYLSDLHLPELFPLIQNELLELDPEAYSPEEWNDAVLYITGVPVCFTDPRQAAAFLQDWRRE